MRNKNRAYQRSGRMVNSVIIGRVLRKILAFLVVVFVLCQFLQAPISFSQTNLLTNNGFEDLDNEGKLIDWKVKNSKIILSQSSDIKKSGQYAAKVETTANPTNYIFQVSEINSSNKYYAEAYGLKISGGAVFLRVAWYATIDGGGSQISTVDSEEVISNSTAFAHILTGTLTPPLSAKSAAVRLAIKPNADGSGVAFFDEVGFYQGESPYAQINPQESNQQQPQPTISFSAPSTVSVGVPFSVSVTLKNFKAGIYSLKVLIGKGEKFYDGRTKGTSGKWLAWNAGWADFPKVSVGSSGSGSKSVQAKTDGDVVAGSYLIKVRAYDGKDTFDSDTKSLKVTGSVASESSGSATNESLDPEGESSFAEATVDKGEILGEEAPPGDKFKLNFYIILGIFGMAVGSGGFMLAFRRGAQRSQTPDTPEQESTPLSERSCTPNG